MIKHDVVILSKLLEGTGNKTTASRISSHLQKDFTTHLKCVSMFASPNDFHNFIFNNNIKFVVGLHVFHTGPFLRVCNVPFLVIFGGTDVNCRQKHKSVYEEIKPVLLLAKCMIAFTSTMKFQALELWPDLKPEDIFIQPQGVITNPCSYTFKKLFLENKIIFANGVENMKVFLLVGGVRPVKDQMYLLDTFNDWHQSDPNVCLVIIGPELDMHYFLKCKEKVERCSGVFMFSAISCCCIHSLITQSVAVINSSISEGMSAVILEAMKLGVPVIARRNDGNTSLVTHGQNGLLFSTSQEFINQAKLILCDNSLRRRLVTNGKLHVENDHNCENEEWAYRTFLQNAVIK